MLRSTKHVKPFALGAIHWGDRTVEVEATREDIRQAPEYDKDRKMTAEHEALL